MYLSKKIDWYLFYGLLTSSIIGLFLSTPFPVSIKIGFFLLLFLIIYFAVNPLLAIVLLLFIRPVIDPFTTIQFSENVNLLGVFSILYIVFFIFLFLSQRQFNIAPYEIRFFSIFILVSILSVINSVNVTQSLMFLLRFISLLAIYLLVYNIIQDRNGALMVVKAIVYSSIIPIIVGFYQYIYGLSYPGFEKHILGFNRLYSTFTHPNMYAFYLVIILFSLGLLYTLEKHINGKSDARPKIVLLILVLLQIVFTYTRGAWIGVMVGLFVVAFFIKETRKWIIISTVLFIIAFSQIILERIADLISPPAKYYMSSWTFRLEHWYALLKNAFVHKPLLGYGLGQSVFAAEKYSALTGIPHNDYLRVLIEAGLLGLISFLLFLAHNLWNLYKKIRIGIYSELNTILLGLFVALLVSSFADNLIYSISVVGYLFALLAVGHKLNSLEAKEQIK